jgi:hypothetical protein
MSEQREWIINARGVPIREAPTFDPGFPWICSTCGGWIFPQRADEHDCIPAPGKEAEWTGKRPTYDELALAVLAYGRAMRAYGDRAPFDHEEWATLCDLARRLEPGP